MFILLNIILSLLITIRSVLSQQSYKTYTQISYSDFQTLHYGPNKTNNFITLAPTSQPFENRLQILTKSIKTVQDKAAIGYVVFYGVFLVVVTVAAIIAEKREREKDEKRKADAISKKALYSNIIYDNLEDGINDVDANNLTPEELANRQRADTPIDRDYLDGITNTRRRTKKDVTGATIVEKESDKKWYKKIMKHWLIRYIKRVWSKLSKFKTIYLPVLVHLFDALTDYLVLIEWAIYAYFESFYEGGNNEEYQHNYIDYAVVTGASIAVLVLYKVISGKFMYKFEGGGCKGARACFYQVADVSVVLEVFQSHLYQDQTDALLYLTKLERIFEASPQIVLQTYVIMKTGDPGADFGAFIRDNYISMVSICFSFVTLCTKMIGDDKIMFVEAANKKPSWGFGVRFGLRSAEITGRLMLWALIANICGFKWLILYWVCDWFTSFALYDRGLLDNDILNFVGYMVSILNIGCTSQPKDQFFKTEGCCKRSKCLTCIWDYLFYCMSRIMCVRLCNVCNGLDKKGKLDKGLLTKGNWYLSYYYIRARSIQGLFILSILWTIAIVDLRNQLKRCDAYKIYYNPGIAFNRRFSADKPYDDPKTYELLSQSAFEASQMKDCGKTCCGVCCTGNLTYIPGGTLPEPNTDYSNPEKVKDYGPIKNDFPRGQIFCNDEIWIAANADYFTDLDDCGKRHGKLPTGWHKHIPYCKELPMNLAADNCTAALYNEPTEAYKLESWSIWLTDNDVISSQEAREAGRNLFVIFGVISVMCHVLYYVLFIKSVKYMKLGMILSREPWVLILNHKLVDGFRALKNRNAFDIKLIMMNLIKLNGTLPTYNQAMCDQGTDNRSKFGNEDLMTAINIDHLVTEINEREEQIHQKYLKLEKQLQTEGKEASNEDKLKHQGFCDFFLRTAIERGHENFIKFLLEENINKYIKYFNPSDFIDKKQNNLLHIAIRDGGHNKVMKEIFYKYPTLVEKKNSDGVIPFFEMIKPNFADVLHTILKSSNKRRRRLLIRSDPSQYDRTAFWIAMHGNYYEVLRVLTQFKECDVNAKDTDLTTALLKATKEANNDVAILLLEHNANIYEYDLAGRTPLMVAAQMGNEELVRKIIEFGKKTIENATTKSKKKEAEEKFRKYINEKDETSESALFKATTENHGKICRLLLKEGADPNANDLNGQTPLIIATMDAENDFRLVKMLIKFNGDVNLGDLDGESAIIKATNKNNEELLDILLSNSKENQTLQNMHAIDYFNDDNDKNNAGKKIKKKDDDKKIDNKNDGKNKDGADTKGDDDDDDDDDGKGKKKKGRFSKKSKKNFFKQAPKVKKKFVHAQIQDDKKEDEKEDFDREEYWDDDNNAQSPGPPGNMETNMAQSIELTTPINGETKTDNGEQVGETSLNGSNNSPGMSATSLENGDTLRNGDTFRSENSLRSGAGTIRGQVIDKTFADILGEATQNFYKKEVFNYWLQACQNNYYLVVELIIKYVPQLDVNQTESLNERTGLHQAAEQGHVETCRKILNRMKKKRSKFLKMNEPDLNGSTAVHLSSEFGHFWCVRALLRRGATSCENDNKNRTPLLLAATNGHFDVVKLLLETGNKVEVDCRDKDGVTPLMAAAEGGHIETVEILLRYGADVNAKEKDGKTPLWKACKIGDTNNTAKPIDRVVMLLLLEQADPTLMDNLLFRTPITLAREGNFRKLIDVLESPLSIVKNKWVEYFTKNEDRLKALKSRDRRYENIKYIQKNTINKEKKLNIDQYMNNDNNNNNNNNDGDNNDTKIDIDVDENGKVIDNSNGNNDEKVELLNDDGNNKNEEINFDDEDAHLDETERRLKGELEKRQILEFYDVIRNDDEDVKEFYFNKVLIRCLFDPTQKHLYLLHVVCESDRWHKVLFKITHERKWNKKLNNIILTEKPPPAKKNKDKNKKNNNKKSNKKDDDNDNKEGENEDENEEKKDDNSALSEETKNKLCVEHMILRYDEKYTEIKDKFLKKPFATKWFKGRKKQPLYKLKKNWKLTEQQPKGWQDKLGYKLVKKYAEVMDLPNTKENQPKKEKKMKLLNDEIEKIRKNWRDWVEGNQFQDSVHSLMRKTIHAKMGFIKIDHNYYKDKTEKEKTTKK